MFDTLYAQIGAFIVVAVCTFAFLKGGETERLTAGAYVLGWFASLLVQNDVGLYGVQWGVFVVDAVMLGVLIALVWRSRRGWVVWASAFQLLAVMSHVLAMVDGRPPIRAVLTVMNVAGYGVLIALAVGTFWSWQERKAAGLE